MRDSRADCSKCKEVEPHSWNFAEEGIWGCNCKSIIKPRKDGRKPLDVAFDLIMKKLGEK